MTFTTSAIAFIFYGALLQVARCNVLNPPYYSSNPSIAAQQALQNNAAYQAMKNNPALNPDIIQNNPLFNYKSILDYPPYALYCDCDCSPYLNQYTVNQINQIADQYNQRPCDLQQLYLIIDSTMPDLPESWRMNMIESLAKGLYDEQARRQLAYLPEYPSFCNNIYPDAMHTMPILTKRSPNPDVSPAYVPPSSINPMAYYYNLNYLMDKIMPDISPQFKQNIKDAVYMNTTPEELGQAPELIRRLTSNLRVTVSQMYDYLPTLY
ncbi:uncharacterized protein LOC135840739 [Planococcus citri]|uniref:uncharacterized protein LOC135840739 n=1 Tax=Planococcus citri TaxID=170843 RepID=UPI0031F8E8B1